MAVNACADLREPEDRGVGDTVERLLGAGGLAIKAMVASIGASCGCNARRDTLNRTYPYP